MITSLGRTASPFTLCRAEWCRRALMTSAYAKTSSSSSMTPKFEETTDLCGAGPDTKRGPPRLFVRPWDGVPSMVDAFAMLRGIEKKYGKIRTFEFVRDGETPSSYFSYFWIELEDPSRYTGPDATVLQIPAPEVERKRPGGIGIADLQPFLRPSLEAQEELHEWTGVTERMVDEVDESKRTNKVFDLRIEPSTAPILPQFQSMDQQKYFLLTDAFLRWGGFASSSVRGAEGADRIARPTFDLLVERAPNFSRPREPSAVRKGGAPPVEERTHKPFNYEFDEPVHCTGIQTPVPSQADKVSSKKSPSLLAMKREGKRLSKKQQALLQAAAISRTPLPKSEERPTTEAGEHGGRGSNGDGATQGSMAEMDEERKRIHNRVWDLVRAKWF